MRVQAHGQYRYCSRYVSFKREARRLFVPCAVRGVREAAGTCDGESPAAGGIFGYPNFPISLKQCKVSLIVILVGFPYCSVLNCPQRCVRYLCFSMRPPGGWAAIFLSVLESRSKPSMTLDRFRRRCLREAASAVAASGGAEESEEKLLRSFEKGFAKHAPRCGLSVADGHEGPRVALAQSDAEHAGAAASAPPQPLPPPADADDDAAFAPCGRAPASARERPCWRRWFVPRGDAAQSFGPWSADEKAALARAVADAAAERGEDGGDASWLVRAMVRERKRRRADGEPGAEGGEEADGPRDSSSTRLWLSLAEKIPHRSASQARFFPSLSPRCVDTRLSWC